MINHNELQTISSVVQRLNLLSEMLGSEYYIQGHQNGNLLMRDETGTVVELEYVDALEWQIVRIREGEF